MFWLCVDKAYFFTYFHQNFSVCTWTGKSTLACSLDRELHSRGKLSYVLDGDNLRHGLNKNLGFSAEDRAENIRRVGKLLAVYILLLTLTYATYSTLLS